MGQDSIYRPEATRTVLLAMGVALLCLAFTSSAFAGGPFHVRQKAQDITGLNHACGAAVDNKGDLYAASAGESKVKVFDPSHTLLASIPNTNEPCGLAVDGFGDLLVSERATGNVVAYGPDAYPLTGSPSYGLPTTVLGSGEAEGISIDPVDKRLYIAAGDRVETYAGEVQQVRVQNATGGSFKLRFEGEETTSLPHNATAAEVQSALEGLSAIGAGDVSVTGAGTYAVSFNGALAYADVPQVEALDSLTGNETQKATVKATVGTYKLRFEGRETAAIPYSAPAAELRAALEALANLEAGDVSVSGGPGDATGTSPYLVTFEGAYASRDVGQIASDASGLAGGTAGVVTSVQGESLEASTTNSGGIGIDEAQRVRVTNALGATYKLRFESEETAPIAAGAPARKSEGAGSVEAALEGLSAIGAGDVSVLPGGAQTYSSRTYLVAFQGALAATDVPQVEAISSLTPNAVQQVTVDATGGSYRLGFKEQTTAPIAFDAPATGAGSLEDALVALGNLAPGDVSVTGGPGGASPYFVEFTGAYAGQAVAQLLPNTVGLTGTASVKTTTPGAEVAGEAITAGWSGRIGDGEFAEAAGVGAYTYAGQTHYLFVADRDGASADSVHILSGSEVAKLKPRRTLDGTTVPDNAACPDCSDGFGFDAATSAIGVDWSDGHFFVYDGSHAVVDEFDATGEYFAQVANAGFADAKPTGIAAIPRQNEIQRVATKSPATVGTFTLSFEGEATAPLPFNATAGQLQVALEGLASIGAGNVTAAGGYSPQDSLASYIVAFRKGLGSEDVPQLLGDGSALGTSHTVNVSTEAQGSGPGRLYVTSGAGVGAKLLTFGAPPVPSRSPLPEASHVLKSAKAVATDSKGDVYSASGRVIHIYGPDGKELASFEAVDKPDTIQVDSTGKLYALFQGAGLKPSEYTLRYYTPSAYPPTVGTTYSAPVTVLTGESFPSGSGITLFAVNPGNDHLFAYDKAQMIEIDSAAHGSTVLNSHWGSGLSLLSLRSIAVNGKNGDVYISRNPGGLSVIDPSGTEILTQITGVGSPAGNLPANSALAVDQSNGHVVLFDNGGGAAREYDASGAFLAEFGSFTQEIVRTFSVAVSSSDGNAYVAFDDTKAETPDLWAFGALSYGEAPLGVTGLASGLGGGNAVLNGAVSPNGTLLETCQFEYLADAQYIANGKTFAGATVVACDESLAAIGEGVKVVPVHATLSSLDPEGSYRFRFVASNKFGESVGDAGLFGAPELTIKSALPVLYGEATLRAGIDPSGLVTKYHFEYGTDESYGQSAPEQELQPGESTVSVQAPLTGLSEGTMYHFRVVAENEASTVAGPDQSFTTLQRRPAESCANVEYRTGLSANLPECRAYELVTPGETGGVLISAPIQGDAAHVGFNDWLAAPRGSGAGESLSFGTSATLPGFLGSGAADGYLTRRGGGSHPASGWGVELVSPNYAQGGGSAGGAEARDGAPDQLYSLWAVKPEYTFEETLPEGLYMRTPDGFEVAGRGSLGTDLKATGNFLSAGGAHLVFSSQAHLDPEAAPSGTRAIYDRAAHDETADVVSLAPDGSPFGLEETASFVASSEDGAAILFRVDGVLYLRHQGATTEIAAAPNAFAGISADEQRVFYAAAVDGGSPGGLYACDVAVGPCAGPGAHAPGEIAASGVFVNVAEDGLAALFTSLEALTGGEENENGETAQDGKHNLYAWDDATTSFVGRLDDADFKGFRGNPHVRMDQWSNALTAGSSVFRGHIPTRSTPDGAVFAFQSHAKLTGYESEGFAEIYRYARTAPIGERLSCVSCDPIGAPPAGDAQFEDLGIPAGADAEGRFATVSTHTIIPNVTDDGRSVFFESLDRLVPEDANEAQDVYRWTASGTEGCERHGGCLALISSGQGEFENFLYSMSADGHDVFFSSLERLVSTDVVGSESIYDARVGGGIPDPVEGAPCQGDACQGAGSSSPSLPPTATTGAGNGNESTTAPARCAKGEHRVKGRCITKHHRKRRHHRRSGRRANHHGRVSR